MNGRFSQGCLNTGFARFLFHAGLAGVLAAGLAGCAATNLPVTSVQSANSELDGGYHVADGDKLRVTVFDEAALTGAYTIGDGGVLAMPLIDSIDAHGKTTDQLAQAIAKKLKDGGYVLSPRVAVEITEHRPFYILGEVAKPGEYPYSGELTVAQAVAKAGGYTPRADKGVVQIKRQDWKTAKKIRFNSQILKVAPGDTITVPEAFF